MSSAVPQVLVHQPSTDQIPNVQEQRPQLHHNITSPDISYHGPPTPQGSSTDINRTSSASRDSRDNSEEAYKLLNDLTNRQSSNYRYVKFNPPIITNNGEQQQQLQQQQQEQQQEPPQTKEYVKQVSFDDVNIEYDDDEPDSDDDVGWELYKAKHGRGKPLRGYSRGRQLSPGPGRISPVASPRRGSTYEETDRFDYAELKKLEKELLRYPTTPISTLRCCSISRRHRLYQQLYKGKLYPLLPVLPHRTILVFISARVHTWVALDWALNKLIENGDRIIVCATLNSTILEEEERRRKRQLSRSQSRSSYVDPYERYKLRSRPENIANIAQNIMDYCMQVINPEKIAKIRVELVAGTTKNVLRDMYKLYEPNLVCTGTKPNLSVGAPLRSWTSSKLTDRLVKNFPLPVIVVPAVNMCDFEYSLQSRINGESISKTVQAVENDRGIEEEQFATDEGAVHVDGDEDEDLRSVNSSDASLSDDESMRSYSSYQEIEHVYKNARDDISRKLNTLEHQPIDADYYANMARAISDNSINLCSDIISIQPNFTGKGAKLARMITGSNNFGGSFYKTKSMLAPTEEEENRRKNTANSSGSTTPKEHKLSFKEVQAQLKRNKLNGNASPTPSGGSQSPTRSSGGGIGIGGANLGAEDHSSPPPAQSLKWGGLERPSKERGGYTNQHALAKCLSDDVDFKHKNGSRNSFDKMKLEPQKSLPHNSKPGSNGDGGMSKWKKFKTLFKGD